MAAEITGVEKRSIASRHGIKPGMVLQEINGHPIRDVLDYRFYMMERELTLLLTEAEQPLTIRLKKAQYDDLGLEFETYLMDKQHSCTNRCIFCFVDQLPKGLRETLYFKDDDARLSFLFGNYVTLTNMQQHEVDRICEMHISPINVSVHTTNPELRVQMMGNRFAGERLRYLQQFAEAGISINTQLVLCPGINDGPELERSLHDLANLYPAVQSIALVPVGLTKHREGLPVITPYNAETAGAVIDLADAFNAEFMQDGRERLAYPADEFFIKAGRPIPDAEYYGAFDQLENGVGLMALLRQEFLMALEEVEESDAVRHLTIATGCDAAPFMKNLVDFLCEKWHNLKCEVVAIENHFLGSSITVSGLVTGQDLIAQLKDRPLGNRVLIPAVMLRREGDLFLDDVTLEQVSEVLGVPVQPVPNDGYVLIDSILQE